MLVVGERIAHLVYCVPCLRVSGSVEPHQDKMGMHTTLLIHFAQDRHLEYLP